METPKQKNPRPGGHKINNPDRPLPRHHTYIPSLSILCPAVEKKIFKGAMKFTSPADREQYTKFVRSMPGISLEDF